MALPNPYILGPHDAYRGRIEACFVSTRNNGQRFGSGILSADRGFLPALPEGGLTVFIIETWQFIENRFVPCKCLGTFDTESKAATAMWAAIQLSGKDMGRFRVAPVAPDLIEAARSAAALFSEQLDTGFHEGEAATTLAFLRGAIARAEA